MSMTNGNKYIGMFKEDKFNGKGKMLDKDGNILQEGNLKDGLFVIGVHNARYADEYCI